MTDDLDTRLLDPTEAPVDEPVEAALRPQRLEDFVGQAKVKEQLELLISGARARGEAVDHVLFSGPPGLGKTTLAGIVAAEMRAAFRPTSGPALARAADLAAILTALDPGDVLFVDEIHRMPIVVKEILYPAMEDFKLDFVIGKGPSARSIRIDLPRFTLVAATTRTGLVSPPLRERFGFSPRLDFYEPDELARIVRRSASILAVDIDADGTGEIAGRSRGTPRIANRLLRRARDYCQVRGEGRIDGRVAHEALTLFDVDPLGLDKQDLAILTCIAKKFGGGPVGLSTLAAATGEETETVEDVYEPYLMQLGFLKRTPRGRVTTEAAHRHLGVPFDAGLF